jgi:hypothetical protein
MIPAQRAISRFRRDLTLGTILNTALAIAAIIGLVFPGGGYAGMVILALVAAAWLGLSYQSVKGSRLAAASPSLIAAGQLDLAEHQIETALRSFSLFRAAKLMVMHHLAMLRHAQRRWEDCAQLCRALLQQRMGSAKNLERPTRLMLAESLLEMGDLNGSYQQLVTLYQQRLGLHEAVSLMALQLDYEARIHAWGSLFSQVSTKAELAELLPAAKSARVQALLALAARKVGRQDWSEWLRRRAELLADVADLTRSRPMLWELWSATPPAPSQVSPANLPASSSDPEGASGR